jgi:hypothetical protein
MRTVEKSYYVPNVPSDRPRLIHVSPRSTANCIRTLYPRLQPCCKFSNASLVKKSLRRDCPDPSDLAIVSLLNPAGMPSPTAPCWVHVVSLRSMVELSCLNIYYEFVLLRPLTSRQCRLWSPSRPITVIPYEKMSLVEWFLCRVVVCGIGHVETLHCTRTVSGVCMSRIKPCLSFVLNTEAKLSRIGGQV